MPFHPAEIPFSSELSIAPPKPVATATSSTQRLATATLSINWRASHLNLAIIPEPASKSFDYENPVLFSTLETWSLAQFFHFYALRSGKLTTSLMKTNVSIGIGNHQNLVVEKFGGARKWRTVNDGLESLLGKEIKRKAGNMTFDVCVEGC